jgi:hypothetical protein
VKRSGVDVEVASEMARWSKAVLVMMGLVVGERETTGPVQAGASCSLALRRLGPGPPGSRRRRHGSRRNVSTPSLPVLHF